MRLSGDGSCLRTERPSWPGGLGHPMTVMESDAEAARTEAQVRVEECVKIPVALSWVEISAADLAEVARTRQCRVDAAWIADVTPDPNAAEVLRAEIHYRRIKRERSISRAVVGKRLRRVYYIGLPHAGARAHSAPYWEAGPTHHTDYGVGFEMDDGTACSVFKRGDPASSHSQGSRRLGRSRRGSVPRRRVGEPGARGSRRVPTPGRRLSLAAGCPAAPRG